MGRCILFQLSALFSLYVRFTCSQDLLQFLLSKVPACEGVIRDITKDPLGDCVLDALNISDNSTAPSLIHYMWRGDESVEIRCRCGYDLLVLQNGGNTSLGSLCGVTSPVMCSSMCINMSTDNSTCLAVPYLTPPCSSHYYCVLYTGLSVGNSSYMYYTLADGLTCSVLQNYASDICHVLFAPTSEQQMTDATTPDDKGFLPVALGAGVGGGVILTTVAAVVIAVVFYLCWRLKAKRANLSLTSPETALSIKNRRFISGSTIHSLDTEPSSLKPTFNQQLFAKVLVDNSNIKITGHLGEGAFAMVQEGLLTSEEGGYLIDKHVAIKRLKDTSTKDEIEEFISESAIMLDFDHPNVLSLLGVCFDTEDHLPLIILPFMANGDLKNYLINHRSDGDVDVLPHGMTQYHLISMCTDIAQGMEYLSRLKFVHRDLAARNCMVDEQLNVKVADFGFSRDVYATQYYRLERKTRLPVKWMPPESLLDNIYNEKTDVWSFGVTCWEVFSLGRSPYPGVDNADVIEYICNERRLHKPALCSNRMYSFMHNCWSNKGSERPSFQAISKSLQEMKSLLASGCSSPDKETMVSSDRPYFVLENPLPSQPNVNDHSTESD